MSNAGMLRAYPCSTDDLMVQHDIRREVPVHDESSGTALPQNGMETEVFLVGRGIVAVSLRGEMKQR